MAKTSRSRNTAAPIYLTRQDHILLKKSERKLGAKAIAYKADPDRLPLKTLRSRLDGLVADFKNRVGGTVLIEPLRDEEGNATPCEVYVLHMDAEYHAAFRIFVDGAECGWKARGGQGGSDAN